MRRLTLFLLPAVMAILAAGQLWAQRGGHGGGISSEPAGAGFHSGLGARSSTYPGFATRPSGSLSYRSPLNVPQAGRFNAQNLHRGNGYPQNANGRLYREDHDRDRDHRGRRPYVSGYGYGSYLVPNFVGYPFGFGPDFYFGDDDQADQSSPQQPESNAGEAQENYPGNYAEEMAPSPPPDEPPGTAYRAPYISPAAAQPVHQQPATTLVFRDGRPNQIVHNYVLTRTALYDLDGDTRKEIPLSEIDLPATTETNRAAGVDFTLPSNR